MMTRAMPYVMDVVANPCDIPLQENVSRGVLNPVKQKRSKIINV